MPAVSRRALPAALYLALIAYLIWGTGVVSDDLVDLARHQRGASWWQAVIPEDNMWNVPAFHVLRMVFYMIADLDHLAPIEAAKVVYAAASFFMLTRFLSLFVADTAAMAIAFLFIFHPSHESTVYWLGGQYLVIGLALYAYAYVHAQRGATVRAIALATLASFTSYGTPPVAWALFAMCAIERRWRPGIALLAPNLVYTAYYVAVSRLPAVGATRLPETWSVATLGRQLALQAFSFLDAVIGPSFWLKVYFSLRENTGATLLVGALVVVALALVLVRAPQGDVADRSPARILFVGLAVLTLANLGMFAVTGAYPQIAFNLGNRVTTLGTLAPACAALTLPCPRPVRAGVLIVLLFAILGLSAHWKAWQGQQADVVARMRASAALASAPTDAPVYVSGNQYSRLGPFSHIEFLSETWALQAVVDIAGHRHLVVRPLNRRHAVEGPDLVDTKYGMRDRLGPSVTVYDSERDRVLRLPPDGVATHVAGLREERRHWVQMIDAGPVRDVIVRLMPRLRYAL